MPRTKIICTIGPASSSAKILKGLIGAGLDIARLNFSHGKLCSHQAVIDLIRKLNLGRQRKIKILEDLEGYRIRIGEFGSAREKRLTKGELVFLSNREMGDKKNFIPFDYEGKLSEIKPGTHIYIDDGNICLLVKDVHKEYIRAEVVIAGVLKVHKGVNLPELNLKFKGLTDKDKTDIIFGIKNRIDYIAQSFVRNKEDILLIRDFIKERNFSCRIIAKIENRQGIKNIDEIIDVSDGIMIARGDMGVSLPIYEIPMIQKMIIKKCRKKRKMVITATQMLESMTENLRPTRAEVADVANAVIDGSGYLMLSAETAAGKHPVESVEMMRRIISFTQRSIR